MQATDFVFPFTYEDRQDGTIVNAGVDLRTWMATHICAGIMSQNENGAQHVPSVIAEWSVSVADALIIELNKS